MMIIIIIIIIIVIIVIIIIIAIGRKRTRTRRTRRKEQEQESSFYRWLALSQNVVFSRALHSKKKIATVLKMTKTKIKRSSELRKIYT